MKKVTIQDIAEKLNLSRNTVSKALNNTGIISDSTRNTVIQTAIKMGYKTNINIEDTIDIKSPECINEIAIFTSNLPSGSHFGAGFLSGLEKKLRNYEIKLSIYIIRESDLHNLELPSNFDAKSIDGIICIEMFDEKYSNLICNLGIPTLFVDCTPINGHFELKSDILLMENLNSVYNLTTTLINNNVKNIAFIGDKNHCQSFYERWQGYHFAVLDNIDLVSTENIKSYLSNYIWPLDELLALPKLPEALICANDFIAISVIKMLKKINISIPEDILVCGFDDSKEATIIEPKLTTIKIPSYEMGDIAADLLLNRIKNPMAPFKTTYIKTSLKYRDSTRKVNTCK